MITTALSPVSATHSQQFIDTGCVRYVSDGLRMTIPKAFESLGFAPDTYATMRVKGGYLCITPQAHYDDNGEFMILRRLDQTWRIGIPNDFNQFLNLRGQKLQSRFFLNTEYPHSVFVTVESRAKHELKNSPPTVCYSCKRHFHELAVEFGEGGLCEKCNKTLRSCTIG